MLFFLHIESSKACWNIGVHVRRSTHYTPFVESRSGGEAGTSRSEHLPGSWTDGGGGVDHLGDPVKAGGKKKKKVQRPYTPTHTWRPARLGAIWAGSGTRNTSHPINARSHCVSLKHLSLPLSLSPGHLPFPGLADHHLLPYSTRTERALEWTRTPLE